MKMGQPKKNPLPPGTQNVEEIYYYAWCVFMLAFKFVCGNQKVFFTDSETRLERHAYQVPYLVTIVREHGVLASDLWKQKTVFIFIFAGCSQPAQRKIKNVAVKPIKLDLVSVLAL